MSVEPAELRNGVLIVWGGGTRINALPGWALAGAGLFMGVCAVVSVAAASAFVFRDDVFVSLMSRQAEMQVDYEDRLAAMRNQIDRLATRKMFDQDTLEGKLQDVVARQSKLETRAAMVAALAQSAGLADEAAVTRVEAQRAPAPAPVPENKTVRGRTQPTLAVSPPLSPTASSYAAPRAAAPATPAGRALEAAVPRDGKPRPEALEVVPARPERGAGLRHDAFDAATPPALRVATLDASVVNIETQQIRTVAAIGEAAQRQTARLTRALADAGLNPDRFLDGDRKAAPLKAPAKGSAMGGPFVPFKLDPKGSLFEREVLRLQEHVRIADRLRHAVARVPLRRPMPAGTETTSSYGSRMDPFLGRPAFHSGLDFRGDHGSPIRATGAGRVIHAGSNGGYGLMVEIDHGDGLTTRYAHLSAVLVEDGQQVAAGAVVGRLGSTGRSTGPHLHYEVRIDDEAVDPMRFLRAGARFAALP